MSAMLNAEWLTWTVKKPPKVYVHDQEMAGEDADETSIPLNPTKNKTAGRGGGWL